MNKQDELIVYTNKVLRIDPHNSEAWHSKGFALSKMNRWEEALYCYDKALAIDPHNSEAWHSKGSSLFKMEKYDEALMCFDNALKFNKEKSIITLCLNEKGESYFRKGKYDESLEVFNYLISIDNNNTKAIKFKGHCLALKDNLNEAIYCYEKVLEIEKGSVEKDDREQYDIMKLFTAFFKRSVNDKSEIEGESPHIVIRNLENTLRKCMNEELNKVDTNWWKKLIPEDVRKRTEERLNGKIEDNNYVSFLDFSDYQKIITNRNNWQYFEKYFGVRERFSMKMDELRIIRNTISHSRTLSKIELKKLYLYSEEITSKLT